ncbi:hypothetical protein [Janthinobacterium sp. NKUCC06_STL]|uniref:hypothetical protein n=1 Tax=Janthinobacterium sp. NKUCC06_STL TaxID=2842127 RepID=UPI001C5A97E5|nr:hypothetical protein [Janthinobacterium sp. NKUCC06_STL]MBW3512068.1 hypothetical protein [Janthinobacterium sp. NKUCC06_STL]
MKDEIRMSFILMREDNALLFDDLHRFPKGTRRINRLRILAYAGLATMSESRLPAALSDNLSPVQRILDQDDNSLNEASVELFGNPLKC